ncbi:MAG: hypothetical protein QM737_09055 [Ferruginibacter sp.]
MLQIKYIAWLLSLTVMLVFQSCRSNPADTRLDEMEIVISKWEKELCLRPVEFEDLVSIQKDITIFDVDPDFFKASYGTLSVGQEERIKMLRTRFKNLMRKSD